MMRDTPTPLTAGAPADFLLDAYVVLDAGGVILNANRALSGLVGHARHYAIGKPLTAYIDPPARAAFDSRLAASRITGQTQDFATRLPGRRRGPPREVRVRLGALRDATGAVAGMQCLLRDITPEIELAAQLAQLEAEHERSMRARTMELQATVRLLQAQLALGSAAAPQDLHHEAPEELVPLDLDAHRRGRAG